MRYKKGVNGMAPDGIFITPLCKKCNNPDNTTIFEVEEFDLVPIPK